MFETLDLEIIGGKYSRKFVWSLAMEHAPAAVGTRVSFVADRICPTHKQLSGNSNQIRCKRETVLSDSLITMFRYFHEGTAVG